MSKSGAPSAAASASVSASSHDPHSLPPNIKGLIQRYLAVSLPTITLSPELIAVLDRADILIPTRVKVTMHWWNEDTSTALSIYPKLNSPLSEPIARHQDRLRQHLQQQQLLSQEKTRQERLNQLQQQKKSLGKIDSTSAVPDASAAVTATTPSTSTAQLPRATVASLLKRPWAGKKLLTALRPSKGKDKSKGQQVLAQESIGVAVVQAQEHRDEIHAKSPMIAATASATKPTISLAADVSDIKPLPNLPESAYPNTVAYPVRCSLDKLHRYFLEMAPLTLEIHIVEGLTAAAAVSNVASLLHNIHGTFSGVFPIASILKNTLTDLASEQLFSQQAVIGMVVFQSWLQDTSDVGDTSECSESSGSIMLESPAGVAHQAAHYHNYHDHNRLSRHHVSQAQQQYTFRPPPQQLVHHHPLHQQHLQQQYLTHLAQPALAHHQRKLSVEYPQNRATLTQPASFEPHSQRVLSALPTPNTPTRGNPIAGARGSNTWAENIPLSDLSAHRPSLRFGDAPHHSGHPQREPSSGQEYRARRSGESSQRPPSRHSHVRQRSHNETSTDGTPWHGRTTSEESQIYRRQVRKSGGLSKQLTTDSDATPSGQRRPKVKIPVPDVSTPFFHARPSSNRFSHPMSSMDESIPYEDRRKSQDTNLTNIYSQGSRSRPRSGATAAAIGRLDSVLARGEDLLLGMRTSIALDPEEVHRSAGNNRHRSSPENELLPMGKTLPYWPSKSRFYLELSIPAAYLTSYGLLKGSSKHSSKSTSMLKEKKREDHPPPALSPFSPPHRHGQGVGSSDQRYLHQQRTRRSLSRFEDVGWERIIGESKDEQSPPSSPPRLLRRSRGPISFEYISPRSADNGVHASRDPSSLTSPRAAYQSFLPEQQAFSPGRPDREAKSAYKTAEHYRVSQRSLHQDEEGQQQQQQQQQQQRRHQPRKSKSYPPQATAPSERQQSRRRRLSSHDRLQIRMNPKAGDILNYVPDLFPSRSMSALVIPEYKGTSSSSSASTDAEDTGTVRGNNKQGRRHQQHHHTRQGTSANYPITTPFASTSAAAEMAAHFRPSSSMERDRQQQQQQQKQKQKQPQNHHQDQQQQQQPHQHRHHHHHYHSQEKDHVKKHRQEFNFQTKCQFHLTPETMAACMIENISVEVWKLNSKRQTMIELGTAKLPLHKVLSQIMQKTAVYPSEIHSQTPYHQQRHHHHSQRCQQHQHHHHQHQHQQQQQQQQQQQYQSYQYPGTRYQGKERPGGSGLGQQFRPRVPSGGAGGVAQGFGGGGAGGVGGGGGGVGASGARKPVWRLEPNVYDIRSRHGTIIGQLDADIWVHARSRSSSMVSAAA
ncbi:hypothetical protein BG004_005702 [Podila humilis]|nr:hypothetical protein BG004_005702 [Podila humilis]